MADAVDTFLREASFDEWGIPDREVPACPQCEGELWIQGDDKSCQVGCDSCGFKREHTVAEVANG